jgi:hypothetical protein
MCKGSISKKENPTPEKGIGHSALNKVGKGEVVPVLNQAPCHEDVLGVKVQLHAFLTSAQDGGEWSDSRPCRFTTGERVPGTHWIEVKYIIGKENYKSFIKFVRIPINYLLYFCC